MRVAQQLCLRQRKCVLVTMALLLSWVLSTSSRLSTSRPNTFPSRAMHCCRLGYDTKSDSLKEPSIATVKAGFGGGPTVLDPFLTTSSPRNLPNIIVIFIVDKFFSFPLGSNEENAMSGTDRTVSLLGEKISQLPNVDKMYVLLRKDLGIQNTSKVEYVSRLPLMECRGSRMMLVTSEGAIDSNDERLWTLSSAYPYAMLWFFRTNVRRKPEDKGISSGIWSSIAAHPGPVVMTGVSKYHLATERNFSSWKVDFASYVYNPISVPHVNDEHVDPSKLVYLSSPNKGLKVAIDIFSHMVHAKQNYTLYVFNPGYNKQNLAAYIPDDIKNHVFVLGTVSLLDLSKHVKSAFAVFYPGNFEETFGNALVEANCHGTPVIHQAVGSLPEVLQNPESQLYRVSSPEEEAEAVMRLLDSWKSSKRPEISCKEYSADNSLAMFSNIFNQIILRYAM